MSTFAWMYSFLLTILRKNAKMSYIYISMGGHYEKNNRTNGHQIETYDTEEYITKKLN